MRHKLGQRPTLIVQFDSEERYMLWQLKVTNIGGGTAYNIRLEWLEVEDNGVAKVIIPKDRDGDVVCFSKVPGYDSIVSLPRGATFSIWIDEFYNFLDKNKPASFLAKVTFQERIKSKNVTEVLYPISLEGHGRVLTYVKEIRRTEFELQKIPGKLEDISKQIQKLREEILTGKTN